jgi:hypothetical protein
MQSPLNIYISRSFSKYKKFNLDKVCYLHLYSKNLEHLKTKTRKFTRECWDKQGNSLEKMLGLCLNFETLSQSTSILIP